MITLALVAIAASGLPAGTLPFDAEHWRIEARESRIEVFDGLPCLYLEQGSAEPVGLTMVDGVIEFKISFAAQRGFVGVAFRIQDDGNYEHVYLRPHQSGNPDANQYTPVLHGVSGWQLYHGEGYGAPVTYPFDQWVPVRVVVSGDEAEIYIGDLDRPAVFVDDLKGPAAAGRVALTSNFAPARFADVRVSPVEGPPLKGRVARTRTARPGAVMMWQVSSVLEEAQVCDAVELTPEFMDGLSWQVVAAETTGLTNLARLAGVTEERNTVLACASLAADRDRTVRVAFGFSDRAGVYLNGRPLYRGDNGYRTRDYRYLGTIGYFDELALPLVKGANRLCFAVSESFGGWGLQAALMGAEGVELMPPKGVSTASGR